MSSLIPRILPLATRCALRAVGAGVAHATGISIASALIPDVAGEALTLLRPRSWSLPEDDLDRVAQLTLLTLLHQTLTEHGFATTGANKAVERAAEAWDLRIFRDPDPTADQVIHAESLPSVQALELARQITRPIAGAPLQEFADAIVARFPETFEAVLRSDERGFRAATLRLQNLSKETLADLRVDFAAAITALTRPQPSLELYDSLRKANAVVEITDLQFKRRATRFRPRPGQDQQLQDWLLSRDTFRILKLTGAAGMGKSRLALELCDGCHAQHWRTGFLPADAPWPENWHPLQDTLIVVDYAASKQIGGRPVLRWLEQLLSLRHNPAATRTRVILIDRTEQGPLWSDWRNSELAADLTAVTLWLDLRPDREEFDAIVGRELERHLRRPPSADEWSTVEKVAARLRKQFRPLFALLTAAAICEEQTVPHNAWSPELLVESILKSQLRQWTAGGVEDAHLELLFEATLTQGACNVDPAFRERVEALDSGIHAALSALSDPVEGLGPILPDLLGEFFVLMRLRGDCVLSRRQPKVVAKAARSILDQSWEHEPTAEYLGFLLQDYLSWKPSEGANPATKIMRCALDRVKRTPFDYGLGRCCFASAWRCPDLQDWVEWVKDVPRDSTSEIVRAISMGLVNATTVEPDAAQCQALADRIADLHEQCGHEQAVREQLAKALFNATVDEPDPARRRALADRIADLHERFGHEPAVREQLASALYNATVVEPDPAQRLALADRIADLHEQYGHEQAVREQLAKALFNATVDEPDPARRRALADRIADLHERFGHEPAVREQLAKALFNATVDEPDPAQRRALADRIVDLHEHYGHEPAVREQLAGAFYNATVVEPDLAQCRALANRIADLHEQYSQEPAVREQLAKALYNATVDQPDPAQRRALADRIADLHERYGHEPAVREQLAKALLSAAVVEIDPAQRLALADRIAAMHEQYRHEPAVRRQLAKAIGNTILSETDPILRAQDVDRLIQLAERFPDDANVAEMLAGVRDYLATL